MARKFDRKRAKRAIAGLVGGLTIKECAEREGVSPSTIVRWRSRLAEGEEEQRSGFLPAVLGAGEERATGFVVEVGPARIHVEREFDARELRRLVDALGRVGC